MLSRQCTEGDDQQRRTEELRSCAEGRHNDVKVMCASVELVAVSEKTRGWWKLSLHRRLYTATLHT